MSVSTDGRTWTDRSVPDLGIFRDIAFGNGIYVAARGTSIGSDSRIARSSDLQNWTTQTIGNTGELNGIHFANGQFVAVGNSGGIYVPVDGVNWTDRSTTTDSIFKVTFGDGVWIATSGVLSNFGRILRSTDNGVTWTAIPNPSSDLNFGVAHGNGVFVAGNRSGQLIRSTDGGLTWTNPANPGGLIDHVAFGSGDFVQTSP